ncbi:MAG: peptidoglycan-N-acetylglucosamine deacetylase, partial [Actinomycetota bacterium]|nr:peptidoglycan-N-acetylglucosamine deacetylase [Actinomycetota bacterium]
MTATVRQTARVGAQAAVALAVLHSAPTITAIPMLRQRLAHLAGTGTRDHLALTFDDGPDPASTPQILDELDRLDWKATFFVLGEQVRRTPSLAAELIAAGHEIASHGDSHRNHLLRSG